MNNVEHGEVITDIKWLDHSNASLLKITLGCGGGQAKLKVVYFQQEKQGEWMTRYTLLIFFLIVSVSCITPKLYKSPNVFLMSFLCLELGLHLISKVFLYLV